MIGAGQSCNAGGGKCDGSRPAILLGIVLGLVAAYIVASLWPVSSLPTEKASELGIVSITVLRGYPKHMEVIYFLIFLTVVPASAIGAWFVNRYVGPGRTTRDPLLWGYEGGKERLHDYKRAVPIWGYLLIALAAAYLYYSRAYLTTDWLGPWYLFSEQGENMSWASAILSGKVLYRDSFCLYGPLMEYPLAFVMKHFGETVFVARAYSLGTYMLAAAIIAAISFAISKRWWQALLTALFLLAFYFPMKQSVNATPLRLLLGILAAFHIYRYTVTGKRTVLFAAGFITGFTFLYSQEKGVAVVMAAFVFWALALIVDWRGASKRIRELFIFSVGTVIPLIPFLFYFYSNDALKPFFMNILEYPRYVMLGYDSLPAPDLIDRLSLFLSGEGTIKSLAFGVAFYLPTLVYALSLAFVAIRYLTGRFTGRDAFALLITLYGIVTFRSALGRSDGFHLVQVYAPAFFVLSYIAALHIRKEARRASEFIIFALVFMLPLGFVMSNFNRGAVERFFKLNSVELAQKFSPKIPKGFVEPKAKALAGVYMPRSSAATIEGLTALKGQLAPTDRVYVFGNVPLFYVLLDRQNPTRYDYPYWAATKEIQREIVRDLKEARPLYMLYKMDRVDTIDAIAPHIRLPILYNYLMDNYRLDDRVNFPGFRIYRRK